MTVQLVLFACTHNAGRSQIANAFFCQLADPAKAVGISAGLEPAAKVQDEIIEVMREWARSQLTFLASFRTEVRLPNQEDRYE